MILNVIIIYCFSVVTASYDPFDNLLSSFPIDNDNHELYRRIQRSPAPELPKDPSNFCYEITQTARTPFVTILLYRTTGRFLGMGSIVNRKTVLTAYAAVDKTMQSPNHLLCLAGSLSPYWSAGSQVKEADEIFVKDKALALVFLKNPFDFNSNIQPIRLAEMEALEYKTAYTEDYAVFGIIRSSFDIPGEKAPKESKYIMKIETIRDGSNGLDLCKVYFPDRDFIDNLNICTFANGTFCWGCIGSPTIAVDRAHEVLQIAVVTKTTQISDRDMFHVHTKLGPYNVWLRAHSAIKQAEEL